MAVMVSELSGAFRKNNPKSNIGLTKYSYNFPRSRTDRNSCPRSHWDRAARYMPRFRRRRPKCRGLVLPMLLRKNSPIHHS
jgi:hypothetical protein